jgi:hypothetical protein
MLDLNFRRSWKVKTFFAVVCFSLSVALDFRNLQIEADKARALEAGVPPPFPRTTLTRSVTFTPQMRSRSLAE